MKSTCCVLAVSLLFTAACDTLPDETALPLIEVEPNDSPELAMQIPLDAVVEGHLSPGDKDYFRLDIPEAFEGYKISLSAFDEAEDCFAGVDPYLQVFGADGETSLYFQEDNFAHYCPTLSFPVEGGQVYYLLVATDWSVSGTYTLSISQGGLGTFSGRFSPELNRTFPSTTAKVPAPRAAAFPGQFPVSVPESQVKGQPPTSKLHAFERVLGEFIIQPLSKTAMPHILWNLKSLGYEDARILRAIAGGRYYLVQIPSLQTPSELLGLPGKSLIRDVWFNRIYQRSEEVYPSDTELSKQWHFGAFPGANVLSAWSVFQGAEDVVVAVLDTGHDPSHPDLQDKFVPGFDFITSSENAGDGDGYDEDASDSLALGHGSHVIGTVAAQTDNSLGVAGVAWNSRYMPLRVCGDYGCTDADVVEALYYAAGLESLAAPAQDSRRADVANLSFSLHDTCNELLQDAVNAAVSRGVVLTVAAGNKGDIASDYSPASCIGAMAIASSTSAGFRAGSSNYGETIDLAAPGVNVYSTVDVAKGSYAYLSGTSMAAPHVAGAAALIKGIEPTLSPASIGQILRETAIVNGDCLDCGAGILDVAAALQLAQSYQVEAASVLWLAQAQKVDGDLAQVHGYADETGSFNLVGLTPGTYELFGGVDLNGDRRLQLEERIYGSNTTYAFTVDGEDYSGDLNVILASSKE